SSVLGLHERQKNNCSIQNRCRKRSMVAMETVTNQYLGGDTSLACSAETQSKIDAQVVVLVRKQHEKALTILKDNRGKLDELASYLYEHETITGEEFIRILNENART
ncbi:MAG: hypothetical protein IKG01_08420, partial [Lachnospiraceae bacterium]|nr:hypothetical protein [Lachnospiraceae bacterium]